MARTYPAKRARIAKSFGSGSTACDVCGELIENGQRIVEAVRTIDLDDDAFLLIHARCADAGEALP